MAADPGMLSSLAQYRRIERRFRASPGFDRLLWALGLVSAALVVDRAAHLARQPTPIDINVYLMGARHLFDGQLYHVRYPSPRLGFTYPPFAALVFGPLAPLPHLAAQEVWAAVNVVALVGLVAVSLRAVRPATPRRRVLQWSLVLLTPVMWLEPVQLTFSFGQVNIVLALLILYDLSLAVPRPWWPLPQGLLTGLAAAVKLTPLIFVPFLLFTRRVRTATVVFLTFVGVAVVMAVLAPGPSWSYWTDYLFDTDRVGPRYYVSNQSLAGALERFHHAPVPPMVNDVATLAAAVGGVALAVWAHRSSSPLLGILVCAVAGMIVSPITWAHHLVWIVPILLWLCLAEDRPIGGPVWAAAGAWFFYWGPIWTVPYSDGRELHWHGWEVLRGNSYFLVMVAFLLGVAAMLWRRGGGGRARGRLGGISVRSPVGTQAAGRVSIADADS